MADIDSIQSNLSNGVRAPTENLPAASAAMFAPASRPIDLISAQQRMDREIATLQYPADIPKYYLTMDIQSYSRQDLFTIGQTSSICYLALPLPLKLVDTQFTKYEQKTMGSPIVGTLANATMPAVTGAATKALGGDLEGAKDQAKSIFSANTGAAAAGGIGANAIDGLDAVVPGAGSAVKAATGYAPNYFLTVLLDGPQYKTHNLSWQFSPRTPQEAETLNRIIRVMNNSMAPGTAFSGAVFTFPRVFRLAFHPNPRYLYKFKPAVLVNFTCDYSGGGVPAFYRPDAATSSQDAPVMITMNASFLELEFWLRSDFGGDDQGAGGTLPDDTSITAGTGRESK